MKNPWLSLWLSAANSWAGAARGFWTAEAVRQQQALAGAVAKRTGSAKRGRASPAKRKSAPRRTRKAGA